MVTRASQRIEVTREPPEIQFLVNEVWYFETRRLCVMAGQIVSGTIKPGMFLNVPMNSSFSATIRIDSIEFAHRPHKELVCLTHQCEDRFDFEIIEGWGFIGETLGITLEGSD
jgi:hypothetical protein